MKKLLNLGLETRGNLMVTVHTTVELQKDESDDEE